MSDETVAIDATQRRSHHRLTAARLAKAALDRLAVLTEACTESEDIDWPGQPPQKRRRRSPPRLPSARASRRPRKSNERRRQVSAESKRNQKAKPSHAPSEPKPRPKSTAKKTAGKKSKAKRKPSARKGKATVGKERNGATAAKRLRPGALDGIVLADLRSREADWPLTASAVGKRVERSSGAVANCLARLEKSKQVRLAKRKPRSYDLKGL